MCGIYYRCELEEMKTDFHGREHRNRPAILHSRPESPLGDRIHRLLIQPEAELAHHSHVAGKAALIDDDLQNYRPLPLGFAGFFGVFGFDLGKNGGGRNPAADAIGAAAESSARARTHAGAFARSDSPADTGSDASAKPCTV
jgi:hypothetical protein